MKYFHRNQSTITTIQASFFLNHRSSTHKKSQKAILLFVDFSKAFDSIHIEKMEQLLLGYSITKETVIAIMML